MRNREDPVAPEDLNAFPSPGTKDLIDKIHKQQLIASLRKVMAEKLTVKQQLVIRLFHFEGCSYSQIARIVNENEDWVKNALCRTKKYFMELMKKEEIF